MVKALFKTWTCGLLQNWWWMLLNGNVVTLPWIAEESNNSRKQISLSCTLHSIDFSASFLCTELCYFINFHPFQRPSFDLIQIFVVSSISVKLPKFVWQRHHNQHYINVAFTSLYLFHKWVQYVREQTYMQCNHKKHYQTRNVSQNWRLLSGLPKVFYKTNNLQSMGMLWLKILQSILYSMYDSINEYLRSFWLNKRNNQNCCLLTLSRRWKLWKKSETLYSNQNWCIIFCLQSSKINSKVCKILVITIFKK